MPSNIASTLFAAVLLSSADHLTAFRVKAKTAKASAATETPYEAFGSNTNGCPSGYYPLTQNECKEAAKQWNHLGFYYGGAHSVPNYPKGCVLFNQNDQYRAVYFNAHERGSAEPSSRPICKAGTSESKEEAAWTVSSGSCTVLGACVQSPNFPRNYENGQSCSIVMSTPSPIQVKAFHTEHGYDKLIVNNHAYSGRTGPNGITPDPWKAITWRSDGSQTASGWRLCTEGQDAQTKMNDLVDGAQEHMTHGNLEKAHREINYAQEKANTQWVRQDGQEKIDKLVDGPVSADAQEKINQLVDGPVGADAQEQMNQLVDYSKHASAEDQELVKQHLQSFDFDW